MEELKNLIPQMPDIGISSAPALNDYQQMRADALNAQPGKLTGYDCPLCNNRGYSIKVSDSLEIVSSRCSCMDIRENLRRIEASGLKDLVDRYTFDAFETRTSWQREMKATALRYMQQPEKRWFVLSGTVGSGKTHICTAICAELMRAGVPAQYFLWREGAPRLKANVNDSEAYARMIQPLKTVKLLYIDDFLKGSVKDGDIHLAFEILDARYRNASLMTIISSERTIEQIMSLDEAVGSRIYERAKDFYLCVVGPDKNQRVRP